MGINFYLTVKKQPYTINTLIHISAVEDNETITTQAVVGTEQGDLSSAGTSPGVFIGVAFAVTAVLVAVVLTVLLLFCICRRRRRTRTFERCG
jgi:hypothetical protein